MTKVAPALQKRDEKDETSAVDNGASRNQRRNRWNSWQILAMSYMAVETLKGAHGLQAAEWRNDKDGDDDANSVLTNGIDPKDYAALVEDEFARADGQDGEGDAAAKAAFDESQIVNLNADGVKVELLGQDLGEGAQDYVGRILGSSGTGADGSDGSGSSSGSPTPPAEGGGTSPGPVEAYVPELDYYGGFSDFASGLGFGEGLSEALAAIDPSMQGLASVAVQFSDDPMSSVSYWQSTGQLGVTFQETDGFSSDWVMQASGFTGSGFEQVQETNAGSSAILEQEGDAATKSLGNSAELIDGQDWDGLLWVMGNYYEFNTIVQVNIVWNNDDITIERTGTVDPSREEDAGAASTEVTTSAASESVAAADAGTTGAGEADPLSAATVIADTTTAGDIADDTPTAGDYPTTISTGENTQLNYAQIIQYANTGETGGVADDTSMLTADAMVSSGGQTDTGVTTEGAAEAGDQDTETVVPNQLVMGGKNDYYSVIQQNSFIEMDDVLYEVRDTIAGAVQNAKIDDLADIDTGGNTQENHSLIVNGKTPVNGAQMTAKEFREAKSDAVVEVVDGDYYEFNTVFQLNLINDNDEIDATVDVSNVEVEGEAGDSGPASSVTQNGQSASNWGSLDKGNGVVATGGNLQYNAATIAKNDAQDDLFVGGIYSQYNLILQVSVMETSNSISQISSILNQIYNDLSDIQNAYKGIVSNGGDGADGGSSSMTLPSSLEELSVRGQLSDVQLT